MIAYARMWREKEEFGFGSDESWLCTTTRFRDWEKGGFVPIDWMDARLEGEGSEAPWGRDAQFSDRIRLILAPDPIRAWMRYSDPLSRAMGRPTREQVITRRASTATTLEALELTNGPTLARLLREGAEKMFEAQVDSAGHKPVQPAELAPKLFLQAFGRKPTTAELALARSVLGAPVSKEGLEDYLWTLVISPEFQLIY